jgi:hypothetical protein
MSERDYMLTSDQLQEARSKLDQAKALVTEIRDMYFGGPDISGARLLGEVVAALADEIVTLDKAIGHARHAMTARLILIAILAALIARTAELCRRRDNADNCGIDRRTRGGYAKLKLWSLASATCF